MWHLLSLCTGGVNRAEALLVDVTSAFSIRNFTTLYLLTSVFVIQLALLLNRPHNVTIVEPNVCVGQVIRSTGNRRDPEEVRSVRP